MNDYYYMQNIRRMLGLDGGYGVSPYQARPMQYVGMNQGGQQQQKSSSNPMSTYNNVMNMMGGGTTATGMTPNATNAMGESYYGWGAQTGDRGAMASPAMYDATTVGSTPAAEAAFGGAGELGGTSGLASGAGEVAGGGSASYLPMAGYIAAAIAGQHMMSGATDRRTEIGGKSSKTSGHRTGDIFSGDMFTEPWMAYAMQQLNVDTPTPGEKTDAAFNSIRQGEGGVGNLLGSIPGTGLQWFDPFGTAGYSFLEDKLGKEMATVLIPHMGLKNVTDWFSGLF